MLFEVSKHSQKKAIHSFIPQPPLLLYQRISLDTYSIKIGRR
jgi:hypothetical protein